ncbi:hypothetical protein OSTOST_01313 [Ostertagia ostertagi]
MIDAFLRHNIYDGFRDAIAEAAYTPTPADLNYPPVKKRTKLHTATQKSKSLITDLSTHPEYWKSEEKLAELYEDLLSLLHNIQTQRNTMSDLIIPHVLNPIEDNKEFVDILAHYNVTINYINIKLICATATAEAATGFLTLKKIDSAIARLHNITLESSLPAESIDLNDIPTIEDTRADHRPTRTVRTVRAVAVSLSLSAHSDKRKQKPAKNSPSPSSSRRQSSQRQEKQPTPDLVCHFCKATGAHFSAGCPNIKSLSDRAITAVSDGKCLYCLKAHSPGYCRRDTPVVSAILLSTIRHCAPTVTT